MSHSGERLLKQPYILERGLDIANHHFTPKDKGAAKQCGDGVTDVVDPLRDRHNCAGIVFCPISRPLKPRIDIIEAVDSLLLLIE